MENHAYSDKNLEEFLQKHFGVSFGIEEVISRNLPVGYSAEATIFKSKKGRVYAFISVEAFVSAALCSVSSVLFSPVQWESIDWFCCEVQELEVFVSVFDGL